MFVLILRRGLSVGIAGVASLSSDGMLRTQLRICGEGGWISYPLEMAGKAGNKSAEGKIKQDMNSAIAEAESFTSSHQMVRLNVNAHKHGSFLDRRRGWSKANIEILVKCVVPPNLEQQLMSKYALQ